MSINMTNPTTLCELIDAAANHVAQIRIATMIRDSARVEKAINEAETLLAAALNKADTMPADWNEDASLETWFPLTAETHKAREEKLDFYRKNAAFYERKCAEMEAPADILRGWLSSAQCPAGLGFKPIAIPEQFRQLSFHHIALLADYFSSGNRMPNDQGESRGQAVGGNAEGEVPNRAPAIPTPPLGSNPAPEGGEWYPQRYVDALNKEISNLRQAHGAVVLAQHAAVERMEDAERKLREAK